MMRLLVFFILFFSFQAQAGNLIFFDSNLHYASDSLKKTTTDTDTKTMYDVTIGFGVSKNNQFMVGWNYTGQSFNSADAGATTTYSTSQMGPRFVFFFDRTRNWRTSFAYNLQTKTTYTAGSNPAEVWKGTGLGADFGYQFEISNGFALGLRLTYSSSTYNESLVNETTYSTISYNRTYMYPSVALTYEL